MKAIMGVLVAGAMVLGLAPAAHATVRYAPTAALTEMGALEQSGLPSVSAPDVSGVSDYGATIASQIEPGGEPTSYSVQYRVRGASEWNSTPDWTLTDNLVGATRVSVTLEPLAPDTAYEVQFVVSNSFGSVTSATSTFRTNAVEKATVSVAKLKGKKSGLTSKVTVSEAGRIGQKASSGMLGPTRCQSFKRVDAAGTYTVTCAFNKQARKALRKKALKLVVATTFEPSSGPAVGDVSRVKVKRKH